LPLHRLAKGTGGVRSIRKPEGAAAQAAAIALFAILAGCDSQPGARADATPPAAAAPAPNGAGDPRCQAVAGGEAPIVAELAGYRRELQQQNATGVLDDNDLFAALEDLDAVAAQMAQGNSGRACALADALKANYALGN
jgi:hypothetical protein